MQSSQGAVEVDPRADQVDRPGDAERRTGREEAVGRFDELASIDGNVAAMPLDRLSDDAAVVEHHELGIDRDVAAVGKPATMSSACAPG